MRRLITAIGLLLVALYLIFLAPQPIFFAAALAMSLLCYREYGALVEAHGIRIPGMLGMLGGLFVLFWPQSLASGTGALPGLVLLAIVSFIAALRRPDLKEVLPQVSCTVLGPLYTFAPWRFAVSLRGESVHLLFFALALSWAGDTAAYYVGRRFGKHRLAPMISPGKSWEGAVASAAGATLFGTLYLGHFLPRLPVWQVSGMALLGNIAGQFGDLAESAMKRGAGVKDSGNLLPGHGGMLDRVDSNLFALPAIFVLYWSARLLSRY